MSCCMNDILVKKNRRKKNNYIEILNKEKQINKMNYEMIIDDKENNSVIAKILYLP